MRELWVWRAVAAFALAGWLSTTWVLWPSGDAPRAPEATAERARPDRNQARRRAMKDRPLRTPKRGRAQPVEPVEPGEPGTPREIPEDLLEAAREQVRGERRERRQAFAEERLDENLEAIAVFVEQQRLDEDTHEALEVAVTANHERMRALFAENPPDDAADPDEVRENREARREKFRDSFDTLEDDVAALLDEDQTEELLEAMRGGPRGGSRGRRPR